MRYRAVFFDAGETLVSPHPSFPELLATTLKREGHDHVTPDLVRDRVHVVAHVFDEAAAQGRLWSTSPEESRAFWAMVYRTLLAELEVPFTDEMAATLYGTFTDVANYQLFDDAVPVLEKLRDAGLRLGLISNFEEWLERLLEHLDVTRFFETRVISGIEGMEKPDPAIFRLALHRLGVQPAESVYVGDNVTFDVEPAEAVGMSGVLIDRRGRHEDFTGTRITSLDELPGVLGL